MLKEEIEYRGISQKNIAGQMGMSHKALNEILNERRTLTTHTAMLFEAVLNVPADSLMRLQLKYAMCAMRQNKEFADRLAEVRRIAAIL